MADVPIHRWRFDPARMEHVCVPPDRWAVPSADRCHGCGLAVTRYEVAASPYADLPYRTPTLNMIAWQKQGLV